MTLGSVVKKRLFVLMVSAVISSFVWAQKPEISLVAPDYPPYYGAGLPEKGFVSQIIVAAMADAGYDVSLQFLPWKRAVEHVKVGQADGLYTVWYREDRESWAVFSKPVYYDEIVFIKKKTLAIDYRTLEDLKPYLISDVLGYMYPEQYQSAALRKKNAMNDHEALKRMVLGGADLALVDKVQSQFLLRNMGESLDYYDYLDPPLERVASHLVLSVLKADAEQIIKKFDKALAAMKASGRVDQIADDAGFSRIGFQ
ncbi:MAG: transporter substrate-binding domain-containing protein [Hahellaceae bacterium]|jgi:polar amino acid transport system substrate-binding protein|nr:transporter substrate-binding domain-containing protein [Hahellaceae bacterium]MCP5211383.1 transporter substrate-binding domain-containing protein [Hahellaceae bacterium]